MHHRTLLIERHAAGVLIQRQREDHTTRPRAAGHHRAIAVHRQGHRLIGQRVGESAGDTSRLNAKGVSDRIGVLDVVVVRVQEPVGTKGRREVGREARRVVGRQDGFIHRQHRQGRSRADAWTVIQEQKVGTYIQRRALGITISICDRRRQPHQMIRAQAHRLVRIARGMHHRTDLIQRHQATGAIHTHREHKVIAGGCAAFHHPAA